MTQPFIMDADPYIGIVKAGYNDRSKTMTTAYQRVMIENSCRTRFNFSNRYDNTTNILIQLRDDDGTVKTTYEIAPGGLYSKSSKMGEGVWVKEFWAKGTAGGEFLDAEEG